MQSAFGPPAGTITETIRGIADRVTYHYPDNGWSVLRGFPFNSPRQQETVIVHQTKVFAGATMEFQGAWTTHPKFGRQFKATRAIQKKPAAAPAQKYLGSGPIKGVGPKIAKKIVTHFAVRIYKEYGDNAIAYVTEAPCRLAGDFYGIGFFSADKVALSIGLATDSNERIMAASREFGHCCLTESQIRVQVNELLEMDPVERLPGLLEQPRTGLRNCWQCRREKASCRWGSESFG